MRLGIALSRVCTPLLSSGITARRSVQIGPCQRTALRDRTRNPNSTPANMNRTENYDIQNGAVSNDTQFMSTRTTLKRFEKLRVPHITESPMKNATKYSSSRFERE